MSSASLPTSRSSHRLPDETTSGSWARSGWSLRLSIRTIEARGSQKIFLNWRDTMKGSPRSADMHIALLPRIFAWAKGNEVILRNPLARVERLHEGSRRDIIWSEEQLTTLLIKAAPHTQKGAKIALWTMQRQADMLTMPILAFDGERVSTKKGKTGARVRVVAAPDILPVLGMQRLRTARGSS